MSEKEVKETDPKLSKIALVSLITAIPVLFTTLMGLDLSFRRNSPLILWCIMVVLALVSLVLAIFSLFQISKSNGKLNGKASAVGTIVLLSCSVLLFCTSGRGCILTKIFMCKKKLHSLLISLELYRYYNDGKYPTAEKWCDLMCPTEDELGDEMIVYVNPEDGLVCPARLGLDERCSYAINPYCEPNSPPDTVLVFETKDGWNQHGGPEIASTENHPYERDRFWGYRVPGCNILFKNGDIKFVRKKRFGELNWGGEQAVSSSVDSGRKQE